MLPILFFSLFIIATFIEKKYLLDFKPAEWFGTIINGSLIFAIAYFSFGESTNITVNLDKITVTKKIFWIFTHFQKTVSLVDVNKLIFICGNQENQYDGKSSNYFFHQLKLEMKTGDRLLIYKFHLTNSWPDFKTSRSIRKEINYHNVVAMESLASELKKQQIPFELEFFKD